MSKKKRNGALMSIKNDTQHHWEPLQKSAVTLSPIIHRTVFEVLPPVFSSSVLFPPHYPHPPPSSRDTRFNVLSHLPAFGCAFSRLAFTVKLIAHMCRPCTGPALPGKTVWPCLECQTLQATGDPTDAAEEKAEHYLHVPSNHGCGRFIILAQLKYEILENNGISRVYLHLSCTPQLHTRK